jgi:hypothetical protein
MPIPLRHCFTRSVPAEVSSAFMVQDGPKKRKKKFCRLRFFPGTAGIYRPLSAHICRRDCIGLQKGVMCK